MQNAIQIKNLSFHYPSSTAEVEYIFHNTSFSLNIDWKLGLVGRNGRGKSTFMQLLQGKYDYDGVIEYDKGLHFVQYPYSVDEAANTLELLLQISGCAKWEVEKELAKLDVKPTVLTRSFVTLSSGEKVKCQIAAIFLKQTKQKLFLLLDEPSANLDVYGTSLLAKYLANQHGFIIVSHDVGLLDATTNHTLSIERQQIWLQKGTYSQYLAEKRTQDQFAHRCNQKLAKEVQHLQQAIVHTVTTAAKLEQAQQRQSGQSDNRVDKGYMTHKAAKMNKRVKNLARRQAKDLAAKQGLLDNVECCYEDVALSPMGSDPIRP